MHTPNIYSEKIRLAEHQSVISTEQCLALAALFARRLETNHALRECKSIGNRLNFCRFRRFTYEVHALGHGKLKLARWQFGITLPSAKIDTATLAKIVNQQHRF